MAKRLRNILQPVEPTDDGTNFTDRPLKRGGQEIEMVQKDKLFDTDFYRETEDRLKE